MKKITKRPETAKEYYEYHQILWNGIIKFIEKTMADKSELPASATALKELIVNIYFSGFYYINCFPCAWAIKRVSGVWENIDCSYYCLLKCNNTIYQSRVCLDGKYYIFELAVNTNNYKIAIEYAKIIRDIPIKEKWLV
jgi:hypothetical protein